MKILLLIRHAKSSWDEAGIPDFDRPLNARGLKDADEMARRLKARVNTIDAFISSPAKRAKATAEKFIAAFKIKKDQLVFEKGLYLAPESFFDKLISNTDNEFNTIAIFSHNPGITDFVNTLTPGIKTDNVPTCGIFAVKANIDNWKDFATAGKELLFYDYPKLPA
ncbi:MAG TPA: histidine phosphatase family protein [Chitinophagaceae bacterium]|nr:histidine phosphatase family protein [Chitinophagaceae bacterium]